MAPHIVEDLRIVCIGGSGTATGIIRSGVTDTAITGIVSQPYNTNDAEHAATANNIMGIDDTLLLSVVSAVGVTDLMFRFRVRRLFT